MANETRKRYDEDFKRHIVELYEAGQTRAELSKEYNLHTTSVALCDFCSSDQRFASIFLQIPPHDGHP